MQADLGAGLPLVAAAMSDMESAVLDVAPTVGDTSHTFQAIVQVGARLAGFHPRPGLLPPAWCAHLLARTPLPTPCNPPALRPPPPPSIHDTCGVHHTLHAWCRPTQAPRGRLGPCPVIVVPHGGPHAAYSAAYYMPFGYLTALGYCIVAVNYRCCLLLPQRLLQRRAHAPVWAGDQA